MIFCTSDLHLGHDKDFIVQARGFKTVEEMNAEIIRRWNERVSPDDDVYVLGDLTLGDIEVGIALIATLNGKLHIMRGNHDTDKKVEKYLELSNVVEVKYVDVLKYDDDKPWAKHVVCLFGHTHQVSPFYEVIKHAGENPYMYNVGMDAHNCTPITIDEIIADIRKKKEELNNEQMANRTYGIE